MKNIYKIKLILLALVVFSSCAVNDDDPVQNLVSKTVLSLDTAFERASSDSYDLVVNVDGDLPYSSRLTYTLDGQEMFVSLDPANRHYAEILKQVEAGTLTIQEAD